MCCSKEHCCWSICIAPARPARRYIDTLIFIIIIECKEHSQDEVWLSEDCHNECSGLYTFIVLICLTGQEQLALNVRGTRKKGIPSPNMTRVACQEIHVLKDAAHRCECTCRPP